MTTGSHNQEVYWYETDRGRQLGQLPGTYIITERRWMPRSMVFLAPPESVARVDDRPLEQHLYQLSHDAWQAAGGGRHCRRSPVR
jgi:hypothetical protein